MRRLILMLALIDIGLFALASGLFELQGGFGGGHGPWDRTLAVLGIPWVWIPWPTVFHPGDYLGLVVVPFVMNSVVVAVCAVGVACASRKGTGPHESRGV